jgi:ABC-type phosphate/phosphonate transport system ATPase subunit
MNHSKRQRIVDIIADVGIENQVSLRAQERHGGQQTK